MDFPKRRIVPWAAVAALLYVPQAHAYLDPVTGSMIIQGLIGAIAGAAVAIKLYWRRLKSWYARVKGNEDAAEHGADQTAVVEPSVAEKK